MPELPDRETFPEERAIADLLTERGRALRRIGAEVQAGYPQCRFGDGEAIARYSMPEGCLVYPDDREQDLCLHHAHKASPRGGMTLIKDYSQGQEFSKSLAAKQHRYSKSWPETRRAGTRPAWAWPWGVALLALLVALAVWYVGAN